MFEPPLTYLDIYMGATFKHFVPCNLPDGTPVPFATDGNWAARAQIRFGYGGDLILTFASDGSGQGLIAFDDNGHVILTLTSAVTSGLTSTFGPLGAPATTHVGDVEAWQISTPTDKRRITNLKVRIYPEATT